MSKTVQLKRGNANVSATYVGAEGEITVNTTDYTLNIHDGVTPGGYTVTGVGGGNIGNLNFTDQTISGLNDNQDIVIDSGNGRVYVLQSVVSEGNIETTNYFLGNGRYLTGISAQANLGNLIFTDQTISGLNNNQDIVIDSGNGRFYVLQSVVSAGNIETTDYFLGNGRYLTGITTQANLGNIIIGGQNIFGLNEPQEPLVLGNGGIANVLVQGNLTVSNLQIFNTNADIIRTRYITVATEDRPGNLSGYVFSPNGQVLSNVGLLHRTQSIFNPNVSVLSLNHDRPVALFYSNLTNELIGNLVVTSSDRPYGPFSNAFVSAFANVNSFSQVLHQNLNEGSVASTDFVATANNGDDTSYYVDLGIAGNLHIDPNFFGDTSSFNDAYLYVTAYDQAGPSTGNIGNLIIGSTNGVIKLFVGNTAEANVVAKITSNAILPGANVSYDLGSSTSQWRDLWVSNNTIYIGGVALGVSADGNLTVNGNTISTGTVTGNITVNLSAINFSANSSGDGNGYSTIQLIPDSTVVGNDQYIIVDPTAPGHIHIRAGGLQDNSYADLILGGEYSNFKIAAGANAQAQISANSHNWTFGVDGTFTLPTEAGLNGSQINSVSNSSGDLNGYTTLQLIPDVTLGTGSDQYLIIDPTAPGHIHIRAGGTQDNSSADLILGGEYSHVRIPAGANSTVYIKSNDYNWQFGSDGVTTFPSGVTFPSGGNLIFDSSAISMIDGISTIHFADSSIQTTAYPGTNVSLTLTGNLTVGNLTVNGNATYINTNSYVVDDNIIQMANANPGDTLDIGFAGHRTVASILQHTGLVRDASENTWKLFSNVIPQPGTTVDFTNAIYDDLTVGNLVTNGNITVNDTLIIAGSIQPIGASPAPSLSGFSSISTVISGNPNEGNITAHNYLIANGGIITSGNITANYVIGNGSELTSVNAATVDILNTNGLGTTFYPTFVENRTNGQILRADVDLSYRTDTNTFTVNNISSSGNITGNTGGFAIGYRDVPQVVFTSNATLALTDAGKHYFSSNSANVITVPNNATVTFNIGTAISIIQQGTANLTITPAGGVTMYLAGNSTSTSRTLGNYGMATLMKVGTDTWFINGTGLN